MASPLAAAVCLWTAAVPAGAQPRQVIGQAGVLGEWELIAEVTEQIEGEVRQLIGKLNLRHIGFCSADGPKEKTGELRLSLSDSMAQVKATLLIDGSECTYSGKRTGGYEGLMSCPDRRAVPLMLWIK